MLSANFDVGLAKWQDKSGESSREKRWQQYTAPMSVVASHGESVPFDEYVRLAEASQDKLDYVNGRVVNVSELVGMAGGSGVHSLITANLIGEAGNRLKGKPCRAYDSNLRVGPGTGRYTHYPDVTIICGEPVYDPRDKSCQTYTNPTAVFEVLSPSTIEYDFGDKFAHYRAIESLREYVMVRQDRTEVITFLRQDDGGWKATFVTDPAARVPLASVGIELSIAEVYEGVTFPPADRDVEKL